MTTPHDGQSVDDREDVVSFSGFTDRGSENIRIDVATVARSSTQWETLVRSRTGRRRFIRWDDVDWYRWSTGIVIPDRYWRPMGSSGFVSDVRAVRVGSSDAQLEAFDQNIFGADGCWSFSGGITDLQPCVSENSPVARLFTADFTCAPPGNDLACDNRDEDCDGRVDEDAGPCPPCTTWGSRPFVTDCCPGLVEAGICRTCTDVLDDELCSEGWVTTFAGGETDRFTVPQTDPESGVVTDLVAGGALDDTAHGVRRIEYRLTREQRLYTFEEDLINGPVSSGEFFSLPLTTDAPGYASASFPLREGGVPQGSIRVIDGGTCSVLLPWSILAQFLGASINQVYAGLIGEEAIIRTFINRVEHVETTVTPEFRTVGRGARGAPRAVDDSFVLRSVHRIIGSDIRCARGAVITITADIKLGLVPGLNAFGERVERLFDSVGCSDLGTPLGGVFPCGREYSCNLYEGTAPMLGPDGQTYQIPIIRENVIVRPRDFTRTANRDACLDVEESIIREIGCTREMDGRWSCLRLTDIGRFGVIQYRTTSEMAASIPTVAGTQDVVFENFRVKANPDPDNIACNIVEGIADRQLNQRIGQALGTAGGALRDFLATQIFRRSANSLGVPLDELRTCSGRDDPICFSGAYRTPSGFVVGSRDSCVRDRCSALRIEPRRINVSPEGLEIVLAESVNDPQAQLVENYSFGSGGIALGGFCKPDRYPTEEPRPPSFPVNFANLRPGTSREVSSRLGFWDVPAGLLRDGLHSRRIQPREICDPRDPAVCEDICLSRGFACSVDTLLGGDDGLECKLGLCCRPDQAACVVPDSNGVIDRFCTNLDGDINNCGACGAGCIPGSSCQDSVCTCMAPQELCEIEPDPDAPNITLICADLPSDPDHCGACGNVCDASTMCDGGLCCGEGEANCEGNACLNILSNPSHCGACGRACSNSEPCVRGVCVPLGF